jgi:hypothetical protein
MRILRLVVLSMVAATALATFGACKKGGGYLTVPTPSIAP